MNQLEGTDYFLTALRQEGVEYIFGNPGHTELKMLDHLAEIEDMSYVLGLNEAVCLAIADGYAMASGKLGVFCAHVLPGLGNAIGMLYDASKTGSPLLLAIGQQDSEFALTEPALWGDLIHQVKPLTKWAYQIEHINELEMALQRAIKIAMTPPTGPVCLSLPKDVMQQKTDFTLASPTQIASRICADDEAIKRASQRIVKASRPLIIVGDEVGKSQAETVLQEFAELIACPVYVEPSSNGLNFFSEHPLFHGTLPRVQKGVLEILENADLIFSVGADIFTMAAFSRRKPLPKDVPLIQLNIDTWRLGKNYPAEIALWGDPKITLQRLLKYAAVHVNQEKNQTIRSERLARLGQQKQTMIDTLNRNTTAEASLHPIASSVLIQSIIDLAPDDTVIVDESNTTGITLRPNLMRRNLRYYALKGGGLGWGLPASIGVALACPNRPVLALLGDGSAMFTIQGLWTAARYQTRVIFLICNNKQYRLIKHRLHHYGGGAAARSGHYPGVELRDPQIDFVLLGHSLGIWSVHIEDFSQFRDIFKRAFEHNGPVLININVEGSYPENE